MRKSNGRRVVRVKGWVRKKGKRPRKRQVMRRGIMLIVGIRMTRVVRRRVKRIGV